MVMGYGDIGDKATLQTFLHFTSPAPRMFCDELCRNPSRILYPHMSWSNTLETERETNFCTRQNDGRRHGVALERPSRRLTLL